MLSCRRGVRLKPGTQDLQSAGVKASVSWLVEPAQLLI